MKNKHGVMDGLWESWSKPAQRAFNEMYGVLRFQTVVTPDGEQQLFKDIWQEMRFNIAVRAAEIRNREGR